MVKDLDHYRTELRRAATRVTATALVAKEKDVLLLTLDDARESVVRAALMFSRGNQTQAARVLGIDRHSLRRWMQRYGLLLSK